MKKFTLLFAALVFVFANGKSQNYLINFTGSGLSSTVETVLVVNLSSGDSLFINGNDTLHLIPNVGIQSVDKISQRLSINPNPTSQSAKIEFYNARYGCVTLEVSDIAGKVILMSHQLLSQGIQTFQISGLKAGIFIVKVNTGDNIYTARLVSNATQFSVPVLKHENTIVGKIPADNLKSDDNIIQMLYFDGEWLLFKGSSGNHARVTTLIPTQHETIDFEFIGCVDADGKNYPVVSVGEQTWMAENLAYLPEVSPPSQGSYDEPYYYVSDYYGSSVSIAKTTANFQNYGVLYNWTASLTCCPAGWHLPLESDWIYLTNYLGSTAGGKMKSIRTEPDTHPRWVSPNEGAVNESGFSAIPGGLRSLNYSFPDRGKYGYWWSSSELSQGYARKFGLLYYSVRTTMLSENKQVGFSIRCLRDN
jgi:uncharacterized protein (TIGR02145 family)